MKRLESIDLLRGAVMVLMALEQSGHEHLTAEIAKPAEQERPPGLCLCVSVANSRERDRSVL